MMFRRSTVSVAGWLGMILSVIAAVAIGGVLYAGEAREAATASQMLKQGVHVAATPTWASSSAQKRRRGGSTTSYTIRYAFWDRQMRRFDGSDTATAAEYASLTDPNRPGTIRGGATVAVVHDRANPAVNGLRSRFEGESRIDWLTIGIASLLTLGAGLLMVWGMRAFMNKRVAVAPVTAWNASV
jgi:hypothetical protein